MSTTEEAIHVKDEIIQRGRQIYDQELKQPLEAEHKGRFVAIEPNTGRYHGLRRVDHSKRYCRIRYADIWRSLN